MRPGRLSAHSLLLAAPPSSRHGSTNTKRNVDTSLAAVRSDSAADTADTATLQLIATIMNQVEKSHAAVLEANAGVQVAPNAGGDTELRSKVVASVQDLSKGLLERDTEVNVFFLVLVGVFGQLAAIACPWGDVLVSVGAVPTTDHPLCPTHCVPAPTAR